MRRRPFKKIFAFSLGVMVFFLLAKVFVAALFLAVLLSIPYLFFRGLKSAFADDDYGSRNYRYNLPEWQQEDEPLFYSNHRGGRDDFGRRPEYRFVEVR